MSRRFKYAVLIVLALILAGVAIYFSPFPQPPGYNHFADSRSFLGIPNAQNVLSNLFFVIVGLIGISALANPPGRLAIAFIDLRDRRFYLLFFIAVFLVGFGSAYYHWAPSNAPLIWDRLPIAMATMALFCAILAERVSFRTANLLLWPLVIIGIATVLYWYYSVVVSPENIAPYAFVQVYPALAIAFILLMFRSPYTKTGYLWLGLLLYLLGRGFELFDRAIYQFTYHVIAGHALKHLLMATSCFLVYMYLRQRKQLQK